MFVKNTVFLEQMTSHPEIIATILMSDNQIFKLYSAP
jgi:hypothetical protein